MPAPTNGLILFWNLETLTGAQIKDLSAIGNNGTITGTASKSGQVGLCRGFDGVDDQIVADTTPSPGASFTIAVWVKPTITDANTLISLDAAGSNYLSYGISSANKFSFTIRETATNRTVTSANTYATGTFYHVVGRYNGDKFYLFVNGVTAASVVTASGTFTWNSFRLGQRVGGLNLYTGSIDELRVYNRPFSLATVINIYNDAVNYPPGGSGVRDAKQHFLSAPAPRFSFP